MKPGRYTVPLIGGAAVATRREVQRRSKAQMVVRRPDGRPVGGWVTDIAELRQCVILCGACDVGFAAIHRKYGYHRDRKWKAWTGGVGGDCDGCREFFGGGLQLYVHESYIGQSYTPDSAPEEKTAWKPPATSSPVPRSFGRSRLAKLYRWLASR